MKKTALFFAAALTVSGLAVAQGVTESTDASKIAAIEAHAQQLTANPQPMAAMDHKGAHHGMHHKKHKAAKKHAMKDDKAADAAAPADADKK